MASAVKDLEIEPTRNRVLSVTSTPPATSALPSPPAQITSSAVTSAIEAPGMPASFRIA